MGHLKQAIKQAQSKVLNNIPDSTIDSNSANIDSITSSSEVTIEHPELNKIMEAGKILANSNTELKSALAMEQQRADKAEKALAKALQAEQRAINAEKALASFEQRVIRAEQEKDNLTATLQKMKLSLIGSFGEIKRLRDANAEYKQKLIGIEAEYGNLKNKADAAFDAKETETEKLLKPGLDTAFKQINEIKAKNQSLDKESKLNARKLDIADMQINALLLENNSLKEELKNKSLQTESEAERLKARIQQYIALVELAKRDYEQKISAIAEEYTRREAELHLQVRALSANLGQANKDIKYMSLRNRALANNLMTYLKEALHKSIPEAEAQAKEEFASLTSSSSAMQLYPIETRTPIQGANQSLSFNVQNPSVSSVAPLDVLNLSPQLLSKTAKKLFPDTSKNIFTNPSGLLNSTMELATITDYHQITMPKAQAQPNFTPKSNDELLEELLPMIKIAMQYGDNKAQLMSSSVNSGYPKEVVEKALGILQIK